MKTYNQQGFTLIELVMVIVILGILAAVALPKFVDLGSDARVASVEAAKGAISSFSAMIHAKFLVGSSPTTVTAEGVTINIVNGYPKAETALATGSGLSSNDYTITVDLTAKTVTVSPVSVAASKIATCSVVYTEASSSTTPPTIVVPTSATFSC